MRKLSIKLLGIVLISASLSSAVTPAFALGGCGPNRHRNGWGECVWGRSKSRLGLEKNWPSGHAYAQWDVALFSVRRPLADRLYASP